MEGKTKFIIIGILIVLIISLFINFQIYSLKNVLEREKNNLRDENVSLTKNIEAIRSEKKQLEEKVDLLNSDLSNISKQKEEVIKQKEELQRQYDLIVKEREEFAKRLKFQPIKATEAEAGTDVSTSALSIATTGDAYWAGILKANRELELQLEEMREKMRSELNTLKLNGEQLEREKSSLELDLSTLFLEKQDLKQQLKTFGNIMFELAREKNTNFELQDNIKSIRNENIVLKQQLKSLRNYKANLENKLRRLQEEKTSFERKFTEMELLLENKLSQIDELKQQVDLIRSGQQAETLPSKSSVNLPPIVVRSQTETPTQQEEPKEGILDLPVGQVSVVNKENNFVIIDLGEDSGIKLGETFKVYRQDKKIATIEVIQLRGSIAACDIKEEIESIKVGDTIK